MATIPGTSADDTLDGTSGDDTFDLTAGGDDVVNGRKGFDEFVFGDAFTVADRVDGGLGFDTLTLNGHYRHKLAFTAETMTNVEQIIIDPGHDTNLVLVDANVAAGVQLTIRGDALLGTNRLKFDGSLETDGAFALYGNEGDDVLIGGAQDDFLSNDIGADVMRGGAGADFFSMNQGLDGSDRIDGGAGLDIMELEFTGGALALTAKTMRSVEDVRIDGLAGVDGELSVANGVTAAGSILSVSWDSDTGGAFRFDGSAESDGSLAIDAVDGNDTLIGGQRDDTLIGSDGDDELTGGRGADRLFAGAGADRFVYASPDDSTRNRSDLLADFAEDDVIDLSAIDADETADGDQAFVLVSAFSHTAGEAALIFLPDAFRTTLLLDVDGDGRADSVIYLLGDQSGFTNFVL